MFIGQMVHFYWHGACVASVITEARLEIEGEPENLRIQSFERGGPVIHDLILESEQREDGKVHSIENCPDLVAKVTSPATVTEPAPRRSTTRKG